MPPRRLFSRWLACFAVAVGAAVIATPGQASTAQRMPRESFTRTLQPSDPPEPPSTRPPRESFTRTLEPWDPAEPPSTPPVIDLTAACIRPVRGGQLEAVFGYDSLGPTSVLVALDPDQPGSIDEDTNVVLHQTLRGQPSTRTVQIDDLGPQVTLFKPGSHPYAFAVRFEPYERVAWQVRVPGEFQLDFWKVTVRPLMGTPCRRDVPDHFAVVQNVEFRFPVPVNVQIEEPRRIVAYEVEFALRTVRSTCSAGGELLPPTVLFGWSAGMNVEPIDPDYEVVGLLDGVPKLFEMTPTAVRPVADVFQRVLWLGPIADVTARCAFGDEIVESDVFWAELLGSGFVIPVTVDGVVVNLIFSQRPTRPLGSRLR